MPRFPLLITLALLLLLPSVDCIAQVKRALLIGINTYETKVGAHASLKVKDSDGPSRWRTQEWPNLKGAINDVKAMKALLTSPKFGFSKDEPYMHLVLQNEATRDRILADMQKYLVDLPAKGDIVVFYYSGHGSLRLNSLSQKGLNQDGSPLDNTIVPVDANTGVFDVRDREIARIFNAALDKGVILTAIFDCCHSGMIARGVPIGTPSHTRFLPYDPRDIHEGPDMKDGREVVAPTDRKDNAALVLSASLSNQLAKEWDVNNESHGAFTVALIGALQALPADTQARDIFKRISVVLRAMGVIDQDPKLNGTEQRRQQPLFGKGLTTGKLRVASEGIDDDGVVLNSGYADSLGVGSELVRIGGERKSTPLRIKVQRVDGLTRSHAKVLSPANATVEAGDLFELDKWVPEESTLLPIWLPPATLSHQQIQNAVAQFEPLRKNSKITWIDDPAKQSPTHIISWDGKQWLLSRAGVQGSQSLGASPRSDVLAAQVTGSGVKLFINLPPSSEVAKQLGFSDNKFPIKVTSSPQTALYMLTGSFDGRRIRYAWFRKNGIEEGKTLGMTRDGIAPCSADSPYPLRSDWVTVIAPNDADSDKTPGHQLAELVLRIDKVYAWLNLPTPPPEDAVGGFPYKLVLRRRSDNSYLENGQTTEGDHVDLLLKTAPTITRQVAPRWVYVLSIDCNGKGTLLFPRNGIENKYPREGLTEKEISILGRLKITPPFGTDTYILLTTDEQLPDPSALNFDAVANKGSSRGTSPLQSLLSSASRATRGGGIEMPTEWSMQKIQVTSTAKSVTQSPE